MQLVVYIMSAACIATTAFTYYHSYIICSVYIIIEWYTAQVLREGALRLMC